MRHSEIHGNTIVLELTETSAFKKYDWTITKAIKAT